MGTTTIWRICMGMQVGSRLRTAVTTFWAICAIRVPIPFIPAIRMIVAARMMVPPIIPPHLHSNSNDAPSRYRSEREGVAGHHHHAGANHHKHHTLAEITAIIDASSATQHAKDLAKRIFSVLASAEAKAHGVPAEEVHFHEVGAVDSVVDILAAAVCLDDLAPSGVIVPRLCEGQGMVRCQHGIVPVPVPAVVNIAAAYDIPLSVIDVQGELVTPTGAAFVAAARTATQLPEAFTVTRVGLGAGKRVYPETSSLLRAFLISPVAS